MNAELEENMLLDVIKVSAKENFTLELEFENGEYRLFDCKSLLKKNLLKNYKMNTFLSGQLLDMAP